MDENARVSDHLSVINDIVCELETIGVKIDDEDKALRLMWSLSSFYEHIKSILIYGENFCFEEVVSKIISEERRLNDEDYTSSN